MTLEIWVYMPEDKKFSPWRIEMEILTIKIQNEYVVYNIHLLIKVELNELYCKSFKFSAQYCTTLVDWNMLYVLRALKSCIYT